MARAQKTLFFTNNLTQTWMRWIIIGWSLAQKVFPRVTKKCLLSSQIYREITLSAEQWRMQLQVVWGCISSPSVSYHQLESISECLWVHFDRHWNWFITFCRGSCPFFFFFHGRCALNWLRLQVFTPTLFILENRTKVNRPICTRFSNFNKCTKQWQLP